MDSGLYAACTALIAQTQALDVASNNLANVNTAGYRGQDSVFGSVLAQKSSATRDEISKAVNDFAIVRGTHVDSAQGSIERTANDFDFAIEGQGFFAIQTKSGVRYTRDGRFRLSRARELTNADGDTVLGDQGAIRLPQGTVSVSEDGTISVDGALVGKLRMTEFSPGTVLAPEGKALYKAPDKSGTLARNSSVKQGAIETSNVNPVSAAVDLITIQRHAELLQRTLSMFHSEFNRIATEDLPKV